MLSANLSMEEINMKNDAINENDMKRKIDEKDD
jgi:hypothetical protein